MPTRKVVVDHDQRLGPGLSVAWGPDKKVATFRQYGGNIAIFDISSQAEQKFFPDVSAFGLVFSPDGKTLVSASRDRTVKLWDLATYRVITTLQGQKEEVHSVAVSPDGKIVASGSDDHTIKLWKTKNSELLDTLIGHSYEIRDIKFSH